ARHRTRFGLDQARGLHVERAVRCAARLEAREPLPCPADFLLVARACSPLGVDGKLLSAPHVLHDSKRRPARVGGTFEQVVVRTAYGVGGTGFEPATTGV